jgi:hypothetical protein
MLPPASLLDRDIIEQKSFIVQAIEAHLNGTVTIEALSAWALKAFHSLNSDDQDIIEQPEEPDTDSDEDETDDLDDLDDVDAGDALIENVLDMLMFADTPDFAPSHADLTAAIARLRG